MHTLKTLLPAAVALYGKKSEVARQLGVSRSEVSKLLSGDNALQAEHVAALARLLDLPPDEAQRLACEAIAANPKNRRRAALLREAFGLPKRVARAAVRAARKGLRSPARGMPA